MLAPLSTCLSFKQSVLFFQPRQQGRLLCQLKLTDRLFKFSRSCRQGAGPHVTG